MADIKLILDDVLVMLAGQKYPTPEKGYSSWGHALSDLKRFIYERAQRPSVDAASVGERRAGKDRRTLDRRQLFGDAAKERRAAATQPATDTDWETAPCFLGSAAEDERQASHPATGPKSVTINGVTRQVIECPDGKEGCEVLHLGPATGTRCVLGEPMMHGPQPYRWCSTHNRLMLACEREFVTGEEAGRAEARMSIEMDESKMPEGYLIAAYRCPMCAGSKTEEFGCSITKPLLTRPCQTCKGKGYVKPLQDSGCDSNRLSGEDTPANLTLTHGPNPAALAPTVPAVAPNDCHTVLHGKCKKCGLAVEYWSSQASDQCPGVPAVEGELISDLQRELAFYFGAYHGGNDHRRDVLHCDEGQCIRVRALLARQPTTEEKK